jgi:tetratricopeptide (TPR) repeat protein
VAQLRSFGAGWSGTVLKDNSTRADQIGAQRTKQVNDGAELYKKEDYNAALRQFYAAESIALEYILVQPTVFDEYNELSNIYFWIDETLQNLKNDEERYVRLIRWMHAAQVAAWLAPEKSRLKINEHLDRARVRLSVFLHRRGRLNESLALAQEAIIVNEALVREAPQGSPERARYLSRLGIAKTGIGKNRRESGMTGWEEPIRIAISHLQEAAEVDTKNPDYPSYVGFWRKYLAEELNAEKRKGEALEEERLAKKAYKEAAQRAPGREEVQRAIRDLDERGIR